LTTALTNGDHHADFTFREHQPEAALTVHALLEMTPATPPTDTTALHHGGDREPVAVRSEHVRYAQLVLTDSVRRQVLAAGTYLAQTARAAFVPDPQRSIAERVARLEHGLHTALQRLQDLAGRLDGVDLHTAGAGRRAPRGASGHAATAQTTAADAAPDERAMAERDLLGSCLVSSEVRGLAARTLLPEDFTDDRVAQTWQVLGELHRRGDPIDFVLVAAELERRGGGSAAPRFGLNAGELFQLATRHRSSNAPLGWMSLEPVVRSALERAVAAAHSSLKCSASDPALSAAQLVRRAHAALVRGHKDVRRLGDQTGDLFSPAPVPRAALSAGAAAVAVPTPAAAQQPERASAPTVGARARV
jgi:hypothetical protein